MIIDFLSRLGLVGLEDEIDLERLEDGFGIETGEGGVFFGNQGLGGVEAAKPKSTNAGVGWGIGGTTVGEIEKNEEVEIAWLGYRSR